MQHPDEGTIHAWLDGALTADEARALEAHVAGCAQCAAAVTEAHGLLAASSRILFALDAVPGGVLPAAEPGQARDGRKIPVGRPSLWRSPGWRAAAAIVLVGSVSWLATRSVHRGEVGTVASRSDRASAAARESAAMVAVPLADTLSQLAQGAAQPAARPTPPGAGAGRMGPAVAAKKMASADVPATSSAAAVAEAQAAPPQLAAAPTVRPYAMPRLAEAPNVGTTGGGAAAARAPAPGAQAPASANATREESRVADVELGVRSAVTAQARMKSSAPGAASGALSRQEPSRTLDADVERLAGCYSIETLMSQSSLSAVRSAATLVPSRIELSPDRDPSAGGSWRILRPAPGAAPFRLAARARWLVLAADSVKLEIGEGVESVSARLAVKGDSIGGPATVTDPLRPGGGMGTGVRGTRIPCASP